MICYLLNLFQNPIKYELTWFNQSQKPKPNPIPNVLKIVRVFKMNYFDILEISHVTSGLSFPRIGQLGLSDCNSFPRIRNV